MIIKWEHFSGKIRGKIRGKLNKTIFVVLSFVDEKQLHGRNSLEIFGVNMNAIIWNGSIQIHSKTYLQRCEWFFFVTCRPYLFQCDYRFVTKFQSHHFFVFAAIPASGAEMEKTKMNAKSVKFFSWEAIELNLSAVKCWCNRRKNVGISLISFKSKSNINFTRIFAELPFILFCSLLVKTTEQITSENVYILWCLPEAQNKQENFANKLVVCINKENYF